MKLSSWSMKLRLIVISVILSHGYFSWKSDQFYPGLFLPKFKSRHMADSILVTSIRFVSFKEGVAEPVPWKQMLRPFDKRYFRYIIENSRTDMAIRPAIRTCVENNIGISDSVKICIGTTLFDRHGTAFSTEKVKCERF